ncbi:MAG: hypothetical protein ACRDID_04350 [Ktedonobacterales bacterium]
MSTAMMLKAGTAVSVKRTLLLGKVKRLVTVNDGQDLEYLVGYLDHDGVEQERHFSMDAVEVLEPAASVTDKAGA